jgi:hypothetical protein
MKKLSAEEKEAYSVVQSLRGKASAKKIGKKKLASNGSKGAIVRWTKYYAKLGKTYVPKKNRNR